MVNVFIVTTLLSASALANMHSTDNRVEHEYPQLSVNHHVRAAAQVPVHGYAAEHRGRSAPTRKRRPKAAQAKPVDEAISEMLLSSDMGIADNEFSSLLLSAIESNHGDMPIISI
ncbi:hypothetical protein GGF43_003931 [Coemansia sp. RSA 2618]|nr:hypothetical protein GGF43_003931 [Coemansia sp. RSA 2618]